MYQRKAIRGVGNAQLKKMDTYMQGNLEAKKRVSYRKTFLVSKTRCIINFFDHLTEGQITSQNSVRDFRDFKITFL